MDNIIQQVVVQDLSNQIAGITADRAAWRARALVAEKKLEELAEAEAEESDGDDVNNEVDDE